MGRAKNIVYTLGAGAIAGAVLGILFAPGKGEETRKKLKTLKKHLSCHHDEDDKETLQELSQILEQELNRINAKLKKI